ncbi:MAG: hypothetical protein AAB116_07805 [Candidatus Poribacteria bacterium]
MFVISGSFCFLISAMLLANASGGLTNTNVYPKEKWEERKPEEVALSSKKLDQFSEFVGGRGCIVRYGYMIYSWGNQSKCADIASAVKPWFSHFLFKALEDGKILNLDDRISVIEPRLNEINGTLNYKDRGIKWKHLANQTSCYGVSELPGTAFDYNDWQMALFCDTLFNKIYGVAWDNVDELVLHPKLTDQIGCQDNPTLFAIGSNNPGRLTISVRDFARFGLLYLRKGNWNGKQILTEKYAKMAISEPVPNSIPRTKGIEAEMIKDQRTLGSKKIPDNQNEHFGSYSWLWWINGIDSNGKRMWADAPSDTFGAFGHGGIRGMFIMPSLDIIVSYNDAQKPEGWVNGDESPINKAMEILLNSVIRK